MKTTVKNLITGEQFIFVNNLPLSENIVNVIVLNSKRTGDLLNESYRQEIKNKFPIVETKSKITGNVFAYCESKDLHAKYKL
jgi:hypothetical protein